MYVHCSLHPHEGNARRVLAVLPKRFAKYGLTIHPNKTLLVPFERPDRGPEPPDADRRESPGTFDLLGFTHFWSRSRRGHWVVKQKTSDSRFIRGLKSISQWGRSNRHHPMATQHRTLCQKLRGHFAYYGITGNTVALYRFRWIVIGIWRKWLSRRRRRGTIPWDQYCRLLGRYIRSHHRLRSTQSTVPQRAHDVTSRMPERVRTDQ